MKNQPEIRLDGFEGEWDETTLGELGTVIGGGTPKTTEASYWGGDIPWFTPAEIDSSGSGVVAKSERSITTKGLAESSAKLLPPNSVLMTTRASIGHVAINSVPVTTNQGFQSIVPDSENSKWFIYNWVLGHKKELIGEASGSTFLEIGAQAVREFQLFAPSLDEQRAIGNFFADLDTTITESTTKIEKLKNLRATMLVKMFPQGSSKVPEIRLNGFKGFWVDGTLGDSFDDLGYGLNAPAKSFDGRTKYLRITDIDDDSREFLTSDLTSPDADESVIDSYLLNDQELLIARTGNSVGKTHLFNKKSGRTVFAGFLMRAKIKKSYCPEFVFRLTLTKDFASYVRSVSQRSGQPGMNSAELRECPVIYPEALDEQLAIGTFFRELDELIDAEELKLTKLSNLKNTFLTKMFV